MAQNRLLQFQEEAEAKDENARSLEKQLNSTRNEQEKLKQETQMQAEELTAQIKMLQEQLVQVCRMADEFCVVWCSWVCMSPPVQVFVSFFSLLLSV